MKDIKVDSNGDFVLLNGDLDFVEGDDALIQTMLFRLKTVKGDWMLAPSVGADLERFIGEPMRPETYSRITQIVEAELSNIPEINNLKVQTAPFDENTIIVSISCDSLNTSNQEITTLITLDLLTGLVVDRGSVKTPDNIS